MYGSPDFTIAGTLQRTFAIIKRRAGTLIALSAVLYALPVTVLGLIARLGVIPGGAIQTSATTGEPLSSSAGGALIVYGLVSIVVLFVGSLLSTAAVIWVSCERVSGQPATFGTGVVRAIQVLPANIAMTFLMGLALMVGFMLLVVPGVMLMLRWIAAIPSLVVEGAGVLGSLGRSRDLTLGHRWAILGFLLVLALVEFVVFAVIGFGGGFVAVSLLSAGGPTVVQALTLVLNALMSAVNGAAIAAVYVELRRSGEGGLALETAEAFA